MASYSLNPHIPNGRLYLKREADASPVQIQALAMSLSAVVDGAGGKAVELVQHTPKRDKGPQMQIKKEKVMPTPPGRAQGETHSYTMNAFHHPSTAASPYLPLQQNQEAESEFSQGHTNNPSHQHTFERIQFKSATANNGKRRAQQQYFHLIIELWADVRQNGARNPDWVKVAQRISAAVVVRGRSPSHYSNEGPSHSASSSRGGSGGGSGGQGHPYGSGAAGGMRSGFPNLSMGSSSGAGGGSYKSAHYSLASGHPVHVGDPIGLPPMQPDGLSAPSSDDESKPAMEHYDGYQYFPSPLYEAGIHHGAKVESSNPPYDDRRVKVEGSFGTPVSSSDWFGGCGRFQGAQTSRGYYPDMTAGY